MQEIQRYGFDPWVRKIPWRRLWPPTPVFLPGKSHGQRSLTGHSSWGHKQSDMTEHAHTYWTRRLVFFLLNHSGLLGRLAGVMKLIEEGKYKGMMKKVFISLGYILWSGIAGLYHCTPPFKDLPDSFPSKVTVPFYIPISSMRIAMSAHPSNTCLDQLFWLQSSWWLCKTGIRCSFNLYFAGG